ncbi:MAG: FRG domain-containing protein [Verrucomicrobiales bacterium]|jgi:hypothetical protein|nr:FRG domain-containing protein [Verrucomicrobiales bacterium]MBP9226339.1 FRG domain-containing protein [Verrucomicrobiales bacterium]
MREIETVLIQSLENFLEEMVPQIGFQKVPFYRGQGSADWKLLPRLFREEMKRTEFTNWADLESALLISLKQRAGAELGYQPTTELEWMAVAQHYGLPTRLTSWSANALVALFFATDPKRAEEDGVVWRILPGEAAFTISQDYEQVPEQPRLYRPQRTNHAMLNQKTGFLTHPLPLEDTAADSLEDWFELGDEKVSLTKLLIPAAEKAYFRRRLATMGIDHSTLFPGIRGLCRDISEEIYCHTDSYDWVFPE